jgi:hypothetical protein
MTTDWSTFSEDVQARNTRPDHGCGVCKILASVDPEDARTIEAVLYNPALSTRSIHNGMKARGVAIAYETVGKHRKGECS